MDAATYEETASPFAAALLAEEPLTEMPSFEGPLASPFAGGVSSEQEVDAHGAELEALIGELEDPEFEAAVEALVDEAAGRHLSALTAWSAGDGSESAAAEVADWLGNVEAETTRLLTRLEQEYADTPAAVTVPDLHELLVSHEVDDRLGAASEQFLGGIVGKAFKAATSLAGKAVAGIGRLLPMGRIFGLVRRLVRPLVKRVLSSALGRLPVAVRPIASGLLGKLGLAESAPGDLATEFDRELASAMTSATEAEEAGVIEEAEASTEVQVHDALGGLDQARSRLAAQLLEAEPGRPPSDQLEQFIPAVMAAMPLLRAGLKIVGRDRVKRVLAQGIATLIASHVGPQAARTLAPHVAEAGLGLLSLEHESDEQLGAEGLVDTVEETVRAVAALPAEALESPAVLRAELEDAFEAAAARHLPATVLRPDLPGHDTALGEGVWLLMPRGAARRRRYRKFSRVYDVSLTRPVARAVVLPGEDTMEERLLDAGVASWPVPGEVHLFEELPGTRAGHLAAFEGPDADTEEFEELTPATAAVLLGRPGLGTPGAVGPGGRRLFRVVVPGRQVRRGVPRVTLRLLARQDRPVLRVHLHLGERLAHALAGPAAAQQALPLVRQRLSPGVRRSMAGRLARMLGRATGRATPPARAEAVAGAVLTAMLTTLAGRLPESVAALQSAAQDPLPGLTLTYEFPFRDRAALLTGLPETPALTIAPGVRRG